MVWNNPVSPIDAKNSIVFCAFFWVSDSVKHRKCNFTNKLQKQGIHLFLAFLALASLAAILAAVLASILLVCFDFNLSLSLCLEDSGRLHPYTI